VPILLAAALILAAAIWPAGTGPQAAETPAPRTVHTLIVPASAFNPTEDGIDFNKGTLLTVNSGGFGKFHTQVVFPYPAVTIKRVTFYAEDDGGGGFRVTLSRNTVATIGGSVIGQVLSDGTASAFRAFATTDIGPRTINSAYHTADLTLQAPGGSEYLFFCAVIRYEVGWSRAKRLPQTGRIVPGGHRESPAAPIGTSAPMP
jgi:hypothetical protein